MCHIKLEYKACKLFINLRNINVQGSLPVFIPVTVLIQSLQSKIAGFINDTCYIKLGIIGKFKIDHRLASQDNTILADFFI